MNRKEYKDWRRGIRIQARGEAEALFDKYPGAVVINVPYWEPDTSTIGYIKIEKTSGRDNLESGQGVSKCAGQQNL